MEVIIYYQPDKRKSSYFSGKTFFSLSLRLQAETRHSGREIGRINSLREPSDRGAEARNLKPSFTRKLLEAYHALPYAVQALANMFSPRLFEEVRRLKSRGLSNREIGSKLRVSEKTVAKRLKEMRE